MNIKSFAVYSFLFCMLVWSWSIAHAAVWVGPNCNVTWTHPDPSVVQETLVYVDGGYVYTALGTRATCSDFVGIGPGYHELYVVASNPSGVSGASETVPFVITTSAPGIPTGVVISP